MGSIIPYQQHGFMVLGKDKFSFFVILEFKNGAGNEYDVVEIYKSNGTWGITKVADMAATKDPYQFGVYRIIDINNLANYPAVDDYVFETPGGSQLQLAKTADGLNIVAKWIDCSGDSVEFTPAVSLKMYASDNVTVNTLNLGVVQATDVFMSYRSVDGFTWSQAKNVTNNMTDSNFTKYAYMPNIVPDLKHIPVLSVGGVQGSYPNPAVPRNAYPKVLMNWIDDGNWQQYRKFTVADIGSTPVNEPAKTIDFKLNSIFPNPAQDVAELSFNTDASAQVNVDLYTVLGQKVKNVYNSYLESGIHGINITTSDLSSGSYFVKISVGSNTATTVLNVVR